MAREMKAGVEVEECFRVMDLPPEIRNYVWRFAVITDYPIEVRGPLGSELIDSLPISTLRSGKRIKPCRKDDEARVMSILAIAVTCRRVYHEVTPIYYSQNVFRFCYYYAGYRSLTVVTSALRKKAKSSTSTNLGVVDGDIPDFLCLPGLQRFDIQDTTDWPCVEMETMNKLALDLHAKKNPNPNVTEKSSTGCVGSSATGSECVLNGSNKYVPGKTVELKTIDSNKGVSGKQVELKAIDSYSPSEE